VAEKATSKGLAAAIIVEPIDATTLVRKVREETRSVAPTLTLGTSETCAASFTLAELTAIGGRGKLRLWAQIGGQLSEPVEVRADFGDPRPQRKLRERPANAPPAPGPFQKLTLLSRLQRFAARHPLVLFAAFAVLVLGATTTAASRRTARPAG
jgi:hypothetical protein